MIEDNEVCLIRNFLNEEFSLYLSSHEGDRDSHENDYENFVKKYNIDEWFRMTRSFQNTDGRSGKQTLEEQGYRKRTLFLVEEFQGAENQNGDKFRILCAYVGGIKKKKHDSAYRLTYNFMWENDQFSLKGEHSINPLKVEYHASGIHLVSLVNYTDRKKMIRPSIGELHQRHYDRGLALTLMDDDDW